MQNDHEPAQTRRELARERTEFAEDRTILAHERSYAGWVRTGMASVGIGLGFNALFGSLHPDWVGKAIATVFLLVAVYVFLSAERRARSMLRRLEGYNVSAIKPMRIRLLSWLLTLTTLSLVGALWLLVDAR
jgi:putative membrane protein